MTHKVAVAKYPSHAEAKDVISRLVYDGHSEVDIAVLSGEADDRGWDERSLSSHGDRAKTRGDWLAGEGVPQATAEELVRAVEAGDTVVAVRCNDANVGEVTRVMEEEPDPEAGAPATSATATPPGAAPAATAQSHVGPATGAVSGRVRVFETMD